MVLTAFRFPFANGGEAIMLVDTVENVACSPFPKSVSLCYFSACQPDTTLVNSS